MRAQYLEQKANVAADPAPRPGNFSGLQESQRLQLKLKKVALRTLLKFMLVPVLLLLSVRVQSRLLQHAIIPPRDASFCSKVSQCGGMRTILLRT